MLFDFGGTLDADGVHWSPRFYDAYRAAGGALDFTAFDPIFQVSDDAVACLPDIRRLAFHAAIEALARLLVSRLPDRVDAGEIAERVHGEAVAVVGRNRPVLERLRRRFRLGVVSNFTGNLQPCLEELGLARLFVTLSDSTLVGWTKPDARIFTHTLARLDVPAQAAWMVGDNFDADIRGAANVGMRTCWIAPPDRAVPPGLVPSARIHRLPDIEAVLA
ncbi:MAG TPA: HAD family hydrolase [Gemmatimonadales bacterium]|nr:HAD family hydrolase [Gemmatimonadales bacterium]